jgi:predicted enzyme related to lactoylglutathione lyase
MLNFNSILLSSSDPKNLTEFYSKVFNKNPDMEMDNYTGFLVGNAFISIGPHDKVKGKNTNPERFIFNLETKEVEKEFDRLKEFAQVVAEPYSVGDGETMKIATLSDPDGNYFQLISPYKAP